MAGIPARELLAAAELRRFGEATVAGITWEKAVYRPEAGIVLPALIAWPEAGPEGVVLWIDGEGKDSAPAAAARVGQWLAEGLAVCAPDLRGYGETAARPWRYRAVSSAMGRNSPETFIAYMLGQSLVGLRATDVLEIALSWQAELPEGAPVHLVARGHATVPALHAAFLERAVFAELEFEGGLASWRELCRGPLREGGNLEHAIHGALQVYDLPDLRRALQEPVACGATR